jgi:hypothetical protein
MSPIAAPGETSGVECSRGEPTTSGPKTRCLTPPDNARISLDQTFLDSLRCVYNRCLIPVDNALVSVGV